MDTGKDRTLTFELFKAYVRDVLARLVKVCIQHSMTSARALGVMRWAHRKSSMLWDSFEADEPIQDVATALYWLSVGSV